jgi:hypothetical protein
MTAIQINRLLDIIDRAVTVAERWADREYPKPDENAEITISRVGDRELPQSPEEYEKFDPPQPSAFEKRLRGIKP